MTQISAKEMIGYRDQVVKCLQEELELLGEMKEYGLFDKEKDENGRQKGVITNENYPKIVEIINGEIQKLQNFDVVLAVVGTVKAGKSTTINAIVGREILPNRNRPMTALPTLIYHTPEQSDPVLHFDNPAVNDFVAKLKTILQKNPQYQKNANLQTEEMKALLQNIQAGWTFKNEYLGEAEIFEFLAGLNDLVRLAGYINNENKDVSFPFEQCRSIERLPQIKVAFRHLTDMSANQGRLVLLDTPGPNEAGQKRLRDILVEQLERSSAVMLVLDYTQLKSEASASVKEELDNLFEVKIISKDRLFALVNKFDQKTANSDNEEQTKDIIFKEFLPEKIEREHIFPLASQHAFLANRMATELAQNGKPEWSEAGWLNDFVKLAYGTRMKAEKWAKEDIEDIQEAIADLIEESRIKEPLENAIAKTQMEAPRIALQSAISHLKALMDSVYNFANIHMTTTKLENEAETQQLEKKLAELQHQVDKLTILQQKTREKLPKQLESIQQELDNKIDKIKKNLPDIFDRYAREQLPILKEKLKELEKENHFLRYDGLGIGEDRKKTDNRREEMTKLKLLLDLLTDVSRNQTIFNDKNNAQEYLGDLQTMVNKQAKDIIKFIQQELHESQSKFKNEIENIQEECQAVFDEIDNALKPDGFEFKKPSFQIQELEQMTLTFSDDMGKYIHESPDEIEKDASYIGAGFMRWLDGFGTPRGWGKEKIKVTVFNITHNDIKDQLLTEVQQYLIEAHEKIEHIFETFEQKWIMEYISYIQQTAQNLLDEIQAAIQFNRNAKYVADEEKKKIKLFMQRNNDICEDYEKVAKIINS